MVKKTFSDLDWLMCISKIRQFIDEYNLELVNLNMKKIDKDKKVYYEAEIEYGLGVR